MHSSKFLFSPKGEQRELNWGSGEYSEFIKSADTEGTICKGKQDEEMEWISMAAL